jgi:hypothetical protein
MERLIPVITSMAMLAPSLIVWLVGIGLALARWRRHPRVSLLSLIAFAVLIVATTTGRFLITWLPLTMQESGWTMAQIGSASVAISAATTMVNTLAWILVLCSIFGWRAGQQQQSFVAPPPPSFARAPQGPEAHTGN